MKYLIVVILGLSLTSCLKKVVEVETANTNIMDPEYGGDQWWIFEDVYVYTNQNNDQFIRFEITLPGENAPQLKPPKIDMALVANGATPVYDVLEIKSNGDYEAMVDIDPTGETNFCIEVGVYVSEENLIINSFTECKAL